MAKPLPVRATLPSTLRVLVAVVVLFAWLLAPGAQTAMATPSGDLAKGDLSLLEGGLVICHADGGADAAGPASTPSKPTGHAHDCLLCPACHFAGQAALPLLDGYPVPKAPLIPTRLAAPPPPATGPPQSTRIAPPPTGPPHSIV